MNPKQKRKKTIFAEIIDSKSKWSLFQTCQFSYKFVILCNISSFMTRIHCRVTNNIWTGSFLGPNLSINFLYIWWWKYDFLTTIDTGCDCGRDEICIDRMCVPDPPPPTCETTVCDEHMVCMYEGMNPVCVCDHGYKPEGGRCVPGTILETVGKMKTYINCTFLQLIKKGNCK